MRFRLALAGLLVGALAGRPLAAATPDVGGNRETPAQNLGLPAVTPFLPPPQSAGHRPLGLETPVDPTFYAVAGCVLLVPWVLLGLTLVGHLHARWSRKAGSRGAPRGRDMGPLAPRGGRGNPWLVP